MKFKRCTMLALICALMFCGAASAGAGLTARLEGSALKVDWNVAEAGECTLTISADGWPMEVLRVQPCGSLERSVDASKRYSIRLRTPNGCLTTEAGATEPAILPTAAPTPIPTAEPTQTPTAVPTPIPTAVPTPAAGPVTGDMRPGLAAQVVDQVNAERARAGLGALRVDGELTRAAQVRAREIAQSFNHTRPDGAAWSTVSASALGENIAMGQKTVDKVMAAWMTSRGHRENILRPGFGSIGAYLGEALAELFGK